MLFIFYQLTLRWLLLPLTRCLGLFSPGISDQLLGRSSHELESHLQKLTLSDRLHVLFFCSSAGEFEQAKPIMERLESLHSAQCIVVFQSISGLHFADRRGEIVSRFLAPFDFKKNWQAVFDHIKPAATIVIRYEAWPAFLRIASQRSRLVLVCASLSQHALTRWYFRRMAKYFAFVHCSDNRAFAFFSKVINHNQVELSGDTKFDRVIDRAARAKAANVVIRFSGSVSRKLLLMGSAWSADVEMMLGAFSQNTKLKDHWTTIVVPHDLSSANIQLISEQIRQRGLTPRLCRDNEDSITVNSADEVIILVRLGILFEQYKAANAVMVGGGCHHKVHNVLEPAAFDLPICFGSSYTSQNEAIELVEKKLARVINTSTDLGIWLESLTTERHAELNLRNWLKSKQGASERIVSRLKSDLNFRT